jgi:hypothetical protein
VPPARPGQPQLRWSDRAAVRLRALVPAAGAAGVALLVLAVVASAFAAGRLTRTTPSAPAPAPTTTIRGFVDEGPETARRDFNWQARASGITVQLRTIIVGTGFTRMELHLEGVPRGRDISALEQLRIRGRDGRDLLPEGTIATIATAASRPGVGSGVDTDVVLDHQVDQQAVGSVELGGLTLAHDVTEQLKASLVDPELQRRSMDSPDDRDWLLGRTTCHGCRLRVTCQTCRTIRIDGSAYRHGRVMVAVEATGPVGQSALNPSRRRVLVTDEAGQSELSGWVDGSGGTGVISVGADLLAAFGPDPANDQRPMVFTVSLQAAAEQVVRGSWSIRQAGS